MSKNQNTVGLAHLEKSLEALEKLLEKLESGDLPLDKALAEFERGVRLTRECQGVLREAESRIEILLAHSDTAEPVAFNPEREADPEAD